jgi:hypothetical protein
VRSWGIYDGDRLVARVYEASDGEPKVVSDLPALEQELERRLALKKVWMRVGGSDESMSWDGVKEVKRGDPGFVEAAIWDGSLGYRVVPENAPEPPAAQA